MVGLFRMAVYAGSEQLDEALQMLFGRMTAVNPSADAPLLRSGLRIRLRCVEPEAFVMFDARRRLFIRVSRGIRG